MPSYPIARSGDNEQVSIIHTESVQSVYLYFDVFVSGVSVYSEAYHGTKFCSARPKLGIAIYSPSGGRNPASGI